jgi:hypothetical protein
MGMMSWGMTGRMRLPPGQVVGAQQQSNAVADSSAQPAIKHGVDAPRGLLLTAGRREASAAPFTQHTCRQEVLHALDGQEAVGVLRLADAVKKDGQVVVVVQLVQVNLWGTGCGTKAERQSKKYGRQSTRQYCTCSAQLSAMRCVCLILQPATRQHTLTRPPST